MSEEKLFIVGSGSFRPDSPFSEAISFNHVRHHGIPYNLLRDIFNLLIKEELQHLKETPNETISTNLQNFLTLVGLDMKETRQFFKEIQKTLLDPDDEESHLILDFIDTIHSKVAWPGWNILIGPKDRLDDSQGNPEPFHLVKNIPQNRKKLYKAALLVVDSYKAYIESPEDFNKKRNFSKALRNAAESIPNLKSVYENLFTPLEYNENSWIAVESASSSRHSSTDSPSFFRLARQGSFQSNGSSSRPSSR